MATHAEHSATILGKHPSTPCNASHITFGGYCLNCGWMPEKPKNNRSAVAPTPKQQVGHVQQNWVEIWGQDDADGSHEVLGSAIGDNREANARLWSAAPDLAAACTRVLKAIEWSITGDRMTDREQAEVLRAALRAAGIDI